MRATAQRAWLVPPSVNDTQETYASARRRERVGEAGRGGERGQGEAWATSLAIAAVHARLAAGRMDKRGSGRYSSSGQCTCAAAGMGAATAVGVRRITRRWYWTVYGMTASMLVVVLVDVMIASRLARLRVDPMFPGGIAWAVVVASDNCGGLSGSPVPLDRLVLLVSALCHRCANQAVHNVQSPWLHSVSVAVRRSEDRKSAVMRAGGMRAQPAEDEDERADEAADEAADKGKTCGRGDAHQSAGADGMHQLGHLGQQLPCLSKTVHDQQPHRPPDCRDRVVVRHAAVFASIEQRL